MNDALRDAFVIEMEYFLADIGIFKQIITSWAGSSGIRSIVLHTGFRGLHLTACVDQHLGELVSLALSAWSRASEVLNILLDSELGYRQLEPRQTARQISSCNVRREV